REGGLRPPFGQVTADELRGQVLGIGGAAAVPTKDGFVAGTVRGNQDVAGAPQLGQQTLQRCRLDLTAALEIGGEEMFQTAHGCATRFCMRSNDSNVPASPHQPSSTVYSS